MLHDSVGGVACSHVGISRKRRLSGVNHLGADLVLPGNLGNGCLVGFPQDRDHLLFGETTLLHGLLAGRREPFSQVTIGPKNLGRSIASKRGMWAEGAGAGPAIQIVKYIPRLEDLPRNGNEKPYI